MTGEEDRVVGGGALWMNDTDGFGHSQEVVRSASGHVRLAAAGRRIKLKAVDTQRVYCGGRCVQQETSSSRCSYRN